MTVGYKRLCSGYDYNQTTGGIDGKEIYIQHDDDAAAVPFASLPVIGSTILTDINGSQVGSCLCRTVRAYFDSGDPNTKKYEFGFSSSAYNPPAQNIDTDKAMRRYDCGTETETVESYSGTASPGMKGKLMHVIIPTGTLTIPKGELTAAENATFISLVESSVGKVNAAAFENHRVGSVLFEGISGGTKYTTGGALRYAYEMRFSFRIVPNTATNCDWNYILKDDLTFSSVAIYTTTDFASLTA